MTWTRVPRGYRGCRELQAGGAILRACASVDVVAVLLHPGGTWAIYHPGADLDRVLTGAGLPLVSAGDLAWLGV